MTPRRSPRRTAVKRINNDDVPSLGLAARVVNAPSVIFAILAAWIAVLLGGIVNAGAAAAVVLGNGLGDLTRVVANFGSDGFLALIRAIGSTLGNFQYLVVDGYHAITSGAGVGFEYILSALTNALQAIATGILTVFETVGLGALELARALASEASDAASAAGDALATGLNAAADGVAHGFHVITSGAGSAFESILSVVLNTLQTIVTGILTVFESVCLGALALARAFASGASCAASMVGDALATGVHAAADGFVHAFNGITSGASSGFEAIGSGLTVVARAVASGGAHAVSMIGDTIMTALNAAADGAALGIENLDGILGNAAHSAASAFSAIGATVLAFGNAAVAAVAAVFTALASGALAAIKVLVTGVSRVPSAVGDAVMTALNASTDGVALGVQNNNGVVGTVATAVYRGALAATTGAVARVTGVVRALLYSRVVSVIFNTVNGAIVALAGAIVYALVNVVDAMVDGLVTVGGVLERGATAAAHVTEVIARVPVDGFVWIANRVVIGAREGVDGAANFTTSIASSVFATFVACAEALASVVLALPTSLAAAVHGVCASVVGSVGRISVPHFGRRRGASDDKVASDDDGMYMRTRRKPRAAREREEIPRVRRRVSSRVDPEMSLATETTPRRSRRASVSTDVSSPRVATPRTRTSTGTRRASMSTRSTTRSTKLSLPRRVGVALICVASNFDLRPVGGMVGHVASAVGGGFERVVSMLLEILKDVADRFIAALEAILSATLETLRTVATAIVASLEAIGAGLLVACNAIVTAVPVAATMSADALMTVLNTAADGVALGVATLERDVVATAHAVTVGCKAVVLGLIAAVRMTYAALIRASVAVGKGAVVSVTFFAVAVVGVFEAAGVGVVSAVKALTASTVFAAHTIADAVSIGLDTAADGVALFVQNLDGSLVAVAESVAAAMKAVAFWSQLAAAVVAALIATACKYVGAGVLIGANAIARTNMHVASVIIDAVGIGLDTAADAAALCVSGLDKFFSAVVSVFVRCMKTLGKGAVVSFTFAGILVVGVFEAPWVGVVVVSKYFAAIITYVAFSAVDISTAVLDPAADGVALFVQSADRGLESVGALITSFFKAIGSQVVEASKTGANMVERSTAEVINIGINVVAASSAAVAAAPEAITASVTAAVSTGVIPAIAKVKNSFVVFAPLVKRAAGILTSVPYVQPVAAAMVRNMPVKHMVNFILTKLQAIRVSVVSSSKAVAVAVAASCATFGAGVVSVSTSIVTVVTDALRASGLGLIGAAKACTSGVVHISYVMGDACGTVLDTAADGVGLGVLTLDRFLATVLGTVVAAGTAIGKALVVSLTFVGIGVVGLIEAIWVSVFAGANSGAKVVAHVSTVVADAALTVLSHCADGVGLGVENLDFVFGALSAGVVAAAKTVGAGVFKLSKAVAFNLARAFKALGLVVIAVSDVVATALIKFVLNTLEVVVLSLHHAADFVGLGVDNLDRIIEAVGAAVGYGLNVITNGLAVTANAVVSVLRSVGQTCVMLSKVPLYVVIELQFVGTVVVRTVALSMSHSWRRIFPKDSAARHTRRADSRRFPARVYATVVVTLGRARSVYAALYRLWRELIVILGENVDVLRARVFDFMSRITNVFRRAEVPRRRVDPAVAEGEAFTPGPRGALSRLGAFSPLPMSLAILSPYSPASPRAWTRGVARAAREPLHKRFVKGLSSVTKRIAKCVERRVRVLVTTALHEVASRVPDMGTDARRTFDMTLFTLACLAPVAFAYVSALRASGLRVLVALTAVTCFVCYYATKMLTATVQRLTLARGMFGYDINKKGTPAGEVRVPEAAGLAPAAVFLACLSVLQVAHMWLGGDTAKDWAVEHNSALATIGFAVFLGFVDDVLELPWRAKMILPAFAAMPLLLSYAGSTTILVPRPLRKLLELVLGSDGETDLGLLDLGPLYYVYMFLLTIFCTNSINIHAGLNGLEAGQSAVIAAAMVLLNVCTIAATGERAPDVGETLTAGMTPAEALKRAIALRAVLGGGSAVAAAAAQEAAALAAVDNTGASMHDAHIFSLCLTAPFLSCTLGLLAHNWYPSKVFVGDTYTYFAGMTLGVAGILGHFSETLVLFFLPQIANFLYSSPQLFKLVPCPRHRLPRLDVNTGLLHPSLVTREPGESRVNMNLVNLFLQILGPQTERTLCLAMLTLQAGCCAAGFAVRAILTGVWK